MAGTPEGLRDMHGDIEEQRSSRGVWAFLELFALSGLAIAQPLFDVLAKNAELLVTRRATGAQTIALVALVLVVPPSAAFALECLAGLAGPAVRRGAHGVLAGAFGAIAVVELLKQLTPFGARWLLVGAAAGGIGLGVLVVRSAGMRQLLHVLAFAPPLIAVFYLVGSPIADAVFRHEAPAAAAAPPGAPARVVVIVLDELPVQSLLDGAGRVDAALYPGFAALASEATWYRNHSTVAAFTAGAVPAILTGRYPRDESALPTVQAYRQNLFTLLPSDYELNAHEVLTRLCPETRCEAGTSGFGGLVKRSAQLWAEFASPRRTRPAAFDVDASAKAVATADAFVGSLEPGRERRLDFVHLELPHYPWRYLPSLQDLGVEGEERGETYLLWSTAPGTTAARQRHLLQVQAVDTILGRIVARLKAIGAYDDTLLVVTADHGVAFTVGESARNPSAVNYPQLMWTPLFVKYPGQGAAVVDDRPSLSIDVLPTIADVLEMEVPSRLDGVSLLDAPRAEGARRLYPWIWLASPRDLEPPPGRAYVEVDGRRGFAAALSGRASIFGGDADLRIYRRGPFGPLIGARAAPLTVDEPGSESATVEELDRFASIVRSAHDVPWAWNEGRIRGVGAGRAVAVAVNGTVAAVSETLPAVDGAAPFTFLIPPSLVRDGANDVRVFLIRGTPTAPTLDPIPLRG